MPPWLPSPGERVGGRNSPSKQALFSQQSYILWDVVPVFAGWNKCDKLHLSINWTYWFSENRIPERLLDSVLLLMAWLGPGTGWSRGTIVGRGPFSPLSGPTQKNKNKKTTQYLKAGADGGVVSLFKFEGRFTSQSYLTLLQQGHQANTL